MDHGAKMLLNNAKKWIFKDAIWAVHPKRNEINGISCFKTVEDLPYGPDASFVGVNRFTTIEVIKSLNSIKAKGAVCFASGFSESVSEDAKSADLEHQLLLAAGEMAILGPNCYGFINYLDGSLLVARSTWWRASRNWRSHYYSIF